MITTSELYCASDGSVQTQGSFGWQFSNSLGHRFAQCSGPDFDYRINSYRTEGYGIRSILRFIIRAFECVCKDAPLYTIYSNNESMISKMTDSLQFPYYFPNATLDAEWDLI